MAKITPTVNTAKNWKVLMASLGTKRVPRTEEQAIEIADELHRLWLVRRQPSKTCRYTFFNLARAAGHSSDITQCVLKLCHEGADCPVLMTLIDRLCTPVEVLCDQADFGEIVSTLQSAIRTGERQKERAAATVAEEDTVQDQTQPTPLRSRSKRSRRERVARA